MVAMDARTVAELIRFVEQHEIKVYVRAVWD
jgi:hypothetical protein